jgi:hypothetical protein
MFLALPEVGRPWPFDQRAASLSGKKSVLSVECERCDCDCDSSAQRMQGDGSRYARPSGYAASRHVTLGTTELANGTPCDGRLSQSFPLGLFNCQSPIPHRVETFLLPGLLPPTSRSRRNARLCVSTFAMTRARIPARTNKISFPGREKGALAG